MNDLVAWAVRVSAFLRKEVAEIFRQPQLLLSLVLGPFLIVLLFGAGLRDLDPTLRTVFVSDTSNLFRGDFRDLATDSRLDLRGVTTDEEDALDRLRGGELDLVVIFPEDARETIQRDQRATVRLYHDRIDPIESRAVQLLTREWTGRVNEEVLRQFVDRGQERLDDAFETVEALRGAVEMGEEAAARALAAELQADVAAVSETLSPTAEILDQAGDRVGVDAVSLEDSLDDATARAADLVDAEGVVPSAEEVARLQADLQDLEELRGLAPRVLVSPFQGDAESIAASVTLAAYYAPAVVALLLQHMIVTFIALSVVRDDELGTTELFRVAPLSPVESLLGRYLAYLVVGSGIAAALFVLLVGGLDVPLRGSWLELAFSSVALLAASIGLGFLVALVSRSDTQAIQASMTVMLASILLSGFILSLDRFVPWLQRGALILPVSHGVQLFRSIMLRGRVPDPSSHGALWGMAAVLFVAALLLLRRRSRRR